MLHRTCPLRSALRSRKKYPYMVSHNKLPWNTVEPGSQDAHKLLAPSFVRVFETAMNNRSAASPGSASALVRTEHPPLTPDEWIFHLPATTYIVAESAEDSTLPLEMVAPFDGWGAGASSEAQTEDEEAAAAAAACGKRVTDSMCLAHYGPLQAAVGVVDSVAEFRSPDLRIMGTAVRVRAPLLMQPAPLSAMWQLHKKQEGGAAFFKSYSLFHYYRPNRAPTELVAAFDKFVPRERPDLSALTEAEPLQGSSSASKKRQVVSPMPSGPVPTSPMYGLMEREAVKPGDTFGCRSRMWGNHW